MVLLVYKMACVSKKGKKELMGVIIELNVKVD